MAGNYPEGVTDNDPHFDMPSVQDDLDEEWDREQFEMEQQYQRELRLQDIRERPENHLHDFNGLQACCTINDAIDLILTESHPALGYNAGKKCDVLIGPCSCGATH